MRIQAVSLLLAFAFRLAAQQHIRDSEIHDPDTLAWWHTTEALSNDSMEGRDTGTAAYQRAAEMVAARFKAAGLQPAGENGTYFQSVPMHQIEVDPKTAWISVHEGEKSPHSFLLRFLQDVTVIVTENLSRDTTGALVFRGYCGKDQMGEVAGKFVVCIGTQRTGLPSGAERAANVRAGDAVGIINVDDPYFSIEPPRWPFAYARSVSLASGEARKHTGKPFLSLRISAEAFTHLLQFTGHDGAAILKAGGAKQPLDRFDFPGGFLLSTHFETTEKDITSPNVLAVLPGSDPEHKNQYVAASAHLDGYGFGTSVNGDTLYNGTLDDAAYVALLIQMADDLHAARATALIPPPKRSILFCVFTGEEKGLLGSRWFVDHSTVPLAQIAADVNLDQLRPLFPLNILTAEALTDTTLGDTARSLGTAMHIELRSDAEPERGLLRRADQFPFLEKHIPAISFIFGYDPGTDAEKRYREWYQVRYHRPQDDLTQPMNFAAARKFNTFFYSLVEAIADTPVRPSINPTSQFAAQQQPPLRQ
jgi:hypothetical protein